MRERFFFFFKCLPRAETCMQLWSPPLSKFSTFCPNQSALGAFQRCVGAKFFSPNFGAAGAATLHVAAL